MAGAVTSTPVEVRAKVSVFARWPMSKAWVTEPSRIQRTSVTCAAFGVATANVCPYPTVDGAEVIVGRAPLKRYGGEKISWFSRPARSTMPPPGWMASAFAAGAVQHGAVGQEQRDRVVDPHRWLLLASVVHSPVAGFQTSAAFVGEALVDVDEATTAGAAGDEHLAVRQDGGVQVPPRRRTSGWCSARWAMPG